MEREISIGNCHHGLKVQTNGPLEQVLPKYTAISPNCGVLSRCSSSTEIHRKTRKVSNEPHSREATRGSLLLSVIAIKSRPNYAILRCSLATGTLYLLPKPLRQRYSFLVGGDILPWRNALGKLQKRMNPTRKNR